MRTTPTWLLGVVLANLVTGCAVLAPPEPAAWDDFVGSFVGEPFESLAYPAGTTKVALSANVPRAIENGNARFARWCSAKGGTSVVQLLSRPNSALRSFYDGLSAKGNAEQASGLSFVAISPIVCLDKGNEAPIAFMVSVPGRPGETEVKEGKVLNRFIRVFFTPEQAAVFSDTYKQREAERSRQVEIRSQGREAQKLIEMQRLRSNPRVGDRTNLGTIIEIRAPLVLVQYDERYRALGNRPAAEWLPIASLLPASP